MRGPTVPSSCRRRCSGVKMQTLPKIYQMRSLVRRCGISVLFRVIPRFYLAESASSGTRDLSTLSLDPLLIADRPRVIFTPPPLPEYRKTAPTHSPPPKTLLLSTFVSPPSSVPPPISTFWLHTSYSPDSAALSGMIRTSARVRLLFSCHPEETQHFSEVALHETSIRCLCIRILQEGTDFFIVSSLAVVTPHPALFFTFRSSC